MLLPAGVMDEMFYLFVPNQLYMFWAMFSPIIRNT